MTIVLDREKYYSKGESFLLGAGLLATRTVYPAGRRLPGHVHQKAYLSVLVKGSYREIGPGFENSVGPGDYIFHPAGEVHEDVMGEGGATLLNLHIPQEFWAKKGLGDFVPGKRTIGKNARLLDLASQVCREMNNSKGFGLIAIEGLALQILDVFLRLTSRPKTSPEVLTLVDAYLTEAFTENLTVDRLAKRFGVRKLWLARAFRQAYGESLGERIIRLRLRKAMQLLNQTRKSLAEIAQESGFYDQSHFSRIFKKKQGISPGQYRRRFTKP